MTAKELNELKVTAKLAGEIKSGTREWEEFWQGQTWDDVQRAEMASRREPHGFVPNLIKPKGAGNRYDKS